MHGILLGLRMFWCILRLSSLAHIRRPWTLLTTQSGLMRLVFVLGTSGEMRLLMALRHEQYAFHMWIHVYESVINIAAIAELQSGGVLAGWEVCPVCVLPWWGELVYSLDKYQPPVVFTIVYVGVIFIHVQSVHILFALSISHFMYSAEWQQAFTGLAVVYLLSMQLGLAEDMKRSIYTVECQKVKHIDPGLRLIIMSRQASGDRGWRVHGVGRISCTYSQTSVTTPSSGLSLPYYCKHPIQFAVIIIIFCKHLNFISSFKIHCTLEDLWILKTQLHTDPSVCSHIVNPLTCSGSVLDLTRSLIEVCPSS